MGTNEESTHKYQEMNQEQVTSLLRFVDATQPEATRRAVFAQLGRDCFRCRNLDRWIGQYSDDVDSFLDWVNVQHGSRYWESLVYSDEKTLVLTGRKVSGCACAFANCEDPPRSLCHHCCKTFQEKIFSALLGREVEVSIDQAFLLGDDRCSTTICIV